MIWSAITLFVLLAVPAFAQGHNHPRQDAQLHDQFYSTWMRPDQPNVSCCNKQDCAPAEARFQEGLWWARREVDGKWLPIPPWKIELNRGSPDGRNHLCVQPPHLGNTVWCFVTGSGI